MVPNNINLVVTNIIKVGCNCYNNPTINLKESI